LASIFFALLSARADSNDAPAIPGLGITLGTGSATVQEIPPWCRGFPTITYRSEPDDGGGLKIYPALESESFIKNQRVQKHFDYLKQVEDGGPIEPIDVGAEYNVDFPTLDFKIVNNSSNSLYFTEAAIRKQANLIDGNI
jgi:hypothetical protein